MTQLKNTPGPWKMRPGLEKSWENVEITGGLEDGYVLTGTADNDADIRLIAAAPELLEHLEWAVSCLHFDPDDLPEAAQKLNAALAAIAKATGQS